MTARNVLTPVDVATILVNNTPFTGWQVVTMGAIATAESGRDACAFNVNDSPGKPTHLSFDAGIFQLNSYWLAKITREMSVDEYGPFIFDPVTNAQHAYEMWKNAFDYTDGGWTAKTVAGYRLWTTYKNGLHLPHVPAALAAARSVGAVG